MLAKLKPSVAVVVAVAALITVLGVSTARAGTRVKAARAGVPPKLKVLPGLTRFSKYVAANCTTAPPT